MHGRKHNPGVLDLPLDIFRTVVPVHSNRIDRCTLFTTGGKKLHDSSEIVGLSGWLADEVGVVWSNTLAIIAERETQIVERGRLRMRTVHRQDSPVVSFQFFVGCEASATSLESHHICFL